MKRLLAQAFVGAVMVCLGGLIAVIVVVGMAR